MKIILSIIFSINFVFANTPQLIDHGKSAATEEAKEIIIGICNIPEGEKKENDIASMCKGKKAKKQLEKKVEHQNEKMKKGLVKVWMNIPDPKPPEPNLRNEIMGF